MRGGRRAEGGGRRAKGGGAGGGERGESSRDLLWNDPLGRNNDVMIATNGGSTTPVMKQDEVTKGVCVLLGGGGGAHSTLARGRRERSGQGEMLR